MSAARIKTRVRSKVSGVAESHSLTLLTARDLVDVSDEPVERGGTNEGFAPTEFFLASLAACTNVISHKIAKKNSIEISALEVRVDAEFDRLGVTLQEEVALPFPQIFLEIRIRAELSKAQFDTLRSDLPRFCPVSKMIEQAGTRIVTDWIVERPAQPV